jgi:anti-anti-sigma factor
MNMSVANLPDGIKKIDLFGRMDILGSQAIQLKLVSEAASEKAFVILDLSNVEFMASIGIGVLVSIATTLKRRDGKLVVLNPQPVVALVLERTVQSIIPIYDTFEAAKKALIDPG